MIFATRQATEQVIGVIATYGRVWIKLLLYCLFSAEPPLEINAKTKSSSPASLTTWKILLAVSSAAMSGKLCAAPSKTLIQWKTVYD